MAVCFNCNSNSDSKNLAFNIPVAIKGGKENIGLSESVSAIFKTHFNITKNSEKNKLVLVLCCDCVSVFTRLYNSRNSFLSLTKGKSFVGKILNASYKPGPRVDTIGIKTKKLGKSRLSVSSKEDKIAAVLKGESILPDFEDEEESSTLSLPRSSFNLNPSNVIDIQEIFPRLQITKLTKDQVGGLSLKAVSANENDSPSCIFICLECKREFLSLELMQAHYNSVHVPVENGFSCNFCPKKFSLEWFYKTHLEKLHCGVYIQYSCPICRNTYQNQQKLEKHKLEDHDIRKQPFNCNHCSDSFCDIFELREHLIKEHANTLEAAAALSNKNIKTPGLWRKCTVCDESFPEGLKQLKLHMKLKHQKVELGCFFCEVTFKKFITLKTHEKLHKTCSKCNGNFQNSKRLMEHMRSIHGPVNTFKCEICGQCFRRLLTINRHYRWHSQIASPFHHCNACSKSYPLASQLSSHILNCHTRPKKEKMKCEECDKKFTHKYEYSNHLESVHKKEGQFSCEICGRKFMWEKSLLRHSWFHAKQTFNDKKIVQVHIKNKTKTLKNWENGTKIETTACFSSETHLFKCPISICSKTEKWKMHFTRHLKTHNLIGYTDTAAEYNLPRNLKCPDPNCRKYFSRKDTLSKHFRVLHSAQSKKYIRELFTCLLCQVQLRPVPMNAHGERHMIKIQSSKNEVDPSHKKDLNLYYNIDKKEFICPICQDKFPVKIQEEFIEHLKTKHLFEIICPTNQTIFSCTECEDQRSFDSLLERENHFLLSHCAKIETNTRKQTESKVWDYYLREGNNAKCKVKSCLKFIKCVQGSTSGLRRHLKAKHKIDLIGAVKDRPNSARKATGKKKAKKNEIWKYYLKEGNTAKCKVEKCPQVMKWGSGTSALHRHLKTQHKIDLLNWTSEHDTNSDTDD